MLILELNPPEGRVLNLNLQDFGRFLMHLEANTRLVKLKEDVVNSKVTFVFYNENYIEGDYSLEIKEENGKIFHNEASFFNQNYIPKYIG